MASCLAIFCGEPALPGCARHTGRTRRRANSQAQRAAYLLGDAPTLGDRAQLCVVEEEQAAVKELRDAAQPLLAIHPLDVLGSTAQKTLNRFSER